MRRLALTALAVTLFGVMPVVSGCKKKKSEPSAGDTPAPTDKPSPIAKGKAEPGKTGQSTFRPTPPPEKLTYDPDKPDIRIEFPRDDLAELGLEGKLGKVVEVRGKMGNGYSRSWPGEPNVRRVAFGMFSDKFGRHLTCITRLPVDWRKAGPGKIVTVVGILDSAVDGVMRLRDAHIKSVDGGPDLPQTTAEQLTAEFAADRAAFDKKYKVGYYCYMTGTLKKIVENPIGKTLHAYKFILDGGSVEVHCHLENERDVDTTPPEEGQKVILLAQYSNLYDNKIKNPTMSGVYVGKAP